MRSAYFSCKLWDLQSNWIRVAWVIENCFRNMYVNLTCVHFTISFSPLILFCFSLWFVDDCIEVSKTRQLWRLWQVEQKCFFARDKNSHFHLSFIKTLQFRNQFCLSHQSSHSRPSSPHFPCSFSLSGHFPVQLTAAAHSPSKFTASFIRNESHSLIHSIQEILYPTLLNTHVLLLLLLQ